jgi:CRISPR-associated protein Csx16
MQYFVSRHAGAHEWASRKGFEVVVITHFDPENVQNDDIVIGTLPIHLAARVCERGGRYLHLVLDLTSDDRGKEISADRMDQLGARIEEYKVYSLNEMNKMKEKINQLEREYLSIFV